jgi:hypothetical protein
MTPSLKKNFANFFPKAGFEIFWQKIFWSRVEFREIIFIKVPLMIKH